jgi:NADPH-dependent glutamate synthase beta subunit-like oxidoreductase
MGTNHINLPKSDKPFIAVSSGTTHVFRTGQQRHQRPIFENKTAPCRQACPIGINISSALFHASKKDFERALLIYLQENPLPGICGRVCYHPCEHDCNRGRFDEPIGIRSFERFLAERDSTEFAKGLPLNSRRQTVGIVGSGPGGLSAAYHLAKLGYNITLFEAQPELGGMLRYGIPPFRLPRSILDREIERILSMGIDIKKGTKIGAQIGWESLQRFDAIFLSPGLQSGKTLFDETIPKEHFLTGLEFLADPYRWAFEDDSLPVVIIGGGNVAMDVGMTLIRIRAGNANKITVVCPEAKANVPALPEEVEEAEEEGVYILSGWAPLAINREKGEIVSLEFYRAETVADPRTGTIKISRVGDEVQEIPADKIIVAVGQCLEDRNLVEGVQVEEGIIKVDEWSRTSVPKVFAGGDAIGEKAFVADAIASGKRGALAIHCYLIGADFTQAYESCRIGNSKAFSMQHYIEAPEKGSPELKKVVSYENINTLFFENASQAYPSKLPAEIRSKTFDEVTEGLQVSQILTEASRCFHCGTCIDCLNCVDFCPDVSVIEDESHKGYSFLPDYCKGCGDCSVACPRNVIEMTEETL